VVQHLEEDDQEIQPVTDKLLQWKDERSPRINQGIELDRETLEARPKTPFLLRLEIWRHLRGCHLPQTFNVRSITPVVYGFVSFRTCGTIFRASLRKGFPAGPLEELRALGYVD
jgi:hypothetical protein